MHALNVYQILNHYTPAHELDAGFGVVDNSANERPDWYEYWPIRKFLQSEALDDDAFYGFLSPKFRAKTSLSSGSVRDFIASCGPSIDVVLFSPSIHYGAHFLNVFDHGEAHHPGLKAVAKRFLDRLGLPNDLDALVTDSRNTVYSNYFIAKPRFWRAWLDINEQMFAIAENPIDPLGAELRAPTTYRGSRNVQMKIFVMERVASWLLATDPSFHARVRDPFVSRSRIYKLPVAIICDALKIAYLTQGRSQYKDVFALVQALRKKLNWQVRLGAVAGTGSVARCLRILKSYWSRDPAA